MLDLLFNTFGVRLSLMKKWMPRRNDRASLKEGIEYQR
jgi:hypothetical protein